MSVSVPPSTRWSTLPSTVLPVAAHTEHTHSHIPRVGVAWCVDNKCAHREGGCSAQVITQSRPGLEVSSGHPFSPFVVAVEAANHRPVIMASAAGAIPGAAAVGGHLRATLSAERMTRVNGTQLSQPANRPTTSLHRLIVLTVWFFVGVVLFLALHS